MRLLNVEGVAHLLTSDGPLAIHEASEGKYGPDPGSIYGDWAKFEEWANTKDLPDPSRATKLISELRPESLRAPSPNPTQVFAVGLNYHDHAAETGTPIPASPPIFTKFQTSIAGASTQLRLSGERVDWEVELVVVIGKRASHVSAADAWRYVAGLTVGQDFSDRAVQLSGPMPQFSLGKSFVGYSPMGPALVTVDEIEAPDDLGLRCRVNGETVQDGRTSGMVFSVSEQIAYLSSVAPLLPGDVIFTGTPAGVGVARKPQRFLAVGDEVVTEIDGLGRIHSICV